MTHNCYPVTKIVTLGYTTVPWILTETAAWGDFSYEQPQGEKFPGNGVEPIQNRQVIPTVNIIDITEPQDNAEDAAVVDGGKRMFTGTRIVYIRFGSVDSCSGILL